MHPEILLGEDSGFSTICNECPLWGTILCHQASLLTPEMSLSSFHPPLLVVGSATVDIEQYKSIPGWRAPMTRPQEFPFPCSYISSSLLPLVNPRFKNMRK